MVHDIKQLSEWNTQRTKKKIKKWNEREAEDKEATLKTCDPDGERFANEEVKAQI